MFVFLGPKKLSLCILCISIFNRTFADYKNFFLRAHETRLMDNQEKKMCDLLGFSHVENLHQLAFLFTAAAANVFR